MVPGSTIVPLIQKQHEPHFLGLRTTITKETHPSRLNKAVHQQPPFTFDPTIRDCRPRPPTSYKQPHGYQRRSIKDILVFLKILIEAMHNSAWANKSLVCYPSVKALLSPTLVELSRRNELPSLSTPSEPCQISRSYGSHLGTSSTSDASHLA